MNNVSLATLLLAGLVAFPVVTHASTEWDFSKGNLCYQETEIDWTTKQSLQCEHCSIESSMQVTAGLSDAKHLYEGDQLRAVKVDDSCNSIAIPTKSGITKLNITHNQDGSLVLKGERGPGQHIRLHQANEITVDGQSYSLWLDGYNPASRNWQYDDAHDKPQLSYTLLLK